MAGDTLSYQSARQVYRVGERKSTRLSKKQAKTPECAKYFGCRKAEKAAACGASPDANGGAKSGASHPVAR